MEQLGSHWADFREILCSRTFRKSVKKVQVSLKSDKNNGYFPDDDLTTSDKIETCRSVLKVFYVKLYVHSFG